MSAPIARIAVEVAPLHLDRLFDYAVPDGITVAAGQRVEVVFAGRVVRGLVVEVGTGSEVAEDRLRPIRRVLGEHVWVREAELELLRWAATRFGAPLADVLRHALPARRVEVERRARELGWFPPGAGRRPGGGPAADSRELAQRWAPYGEAGGLLLHAVAGGSGSYLWRPLPGEDVGARLVELMRACLAGGRDMLVIVPDPASPVGDAVVSGAGDLAVDLRGGPSPRVQYRRWLEARCGLARVVVGERGAAFTPLEQLGLAVVVEEASPALKERRSPRHHAREVVLERARRAGGVGLAVGTVPSAIAWRLLRERRLAPVVPTRAAERAARPRVEVVTAADQPRARLSRQAVRALKEAVAAGAYGVVLAGRRGEGRALVCRACGERLTCSNCATSLGFAGERLACEGCGWSLVGAPRCPYCEGRDLVPLAAGAVRLGRELGRILDATTVVLEGYGQPAPSPPAVLVMTRGSVLAAPPGRVDAVVLPDLDGLLRRPTLDAAEDTVRLACQVAGWTVHGRRSPDASRVVVQTREPGHHALRAVEAWDPGGFWRREATLRVPLRFPPAAHALRLTVSDAARDVATLLRERLPSGDDLLGPAPTDGGFAYLIKCDDRAASLAALRPVRERWSRDGVEARLDVDPVDAL